MFDILLTDSNSLKIHATNSLNNNRSCSVSSVKAALHVLQSFNHVHVEDRVHLIDLFVFVNRWQSPFLAIKSLKSKGIKLRLTGASGFLRFHMTCYQGRFVTCTMHSVSKDNIFTVELVKIVRLMPTQIFQVWESFILWCRIHLPTLLQRSPAQFAKSGSCSGNKWLHATDQI